MGRVNRGLNQLPHKAVKVVSNSGHRNQRGKSVRRESAAERSGCFLAEQHTKKALELRVADGPIHL